MDLFRLVVILVVARISDSARILVIQPTNARSHTMMTEPLFEELAARGHHLVSVTSYPHKPPIPNLHEIDVSYKLPPIISNFSLDRIRRVMPNPFKTPHFMADIELYICKNVLPEAKLQNLLKSDEHFDLVMTETFMTDCWAPFAYKFNAPLVTFMTSSALPWVADRARLPDNPSYIPNYLVDFSSDMTLFERIYNSAVLVYAKLVHRYYTLPRAQRLIDQHFGDAYPTMDKLIENTSLIFVNSHYSLSMSRPFPPNVVEVGGIHIRESTVPLPKDLQEILDQSHQGVILMSFGSLVRVASIPPHIIRMFMTVFTTIPQTVIFKYEEDLPGVPPNVVIRKWLPQRQIIEHKNVKALLAHGGLGSTIESVYFGKPLIGIPFFADQHLNIKLVVRLGAGIMLNLDNLSEQKISTAIQEILNNPIYTENMRQLSLQFRDRPMTALQTAVFWTEYVIRHQGAAHLRPASVSLPLYQYLLLDVIAVLLLSPAAVVTALYFILKKTLSSLTRKSRGLKQINDSKKTN